MSVLAIGADHTIRDAPQLTLEGRALHLEGAIFVSVFR